MKSTALPAARQAALTKRHVLKSLEANQNWLDSHVRANGDPRTYWRAEDILTGCVQILNQCHENLEGWLDRKPYRRKVLRRIQKSWMTKVGKRTLRDLIRWTTAVVEAATWVENFWVGSLPLSREPKRLSRAHYQALQAGRKRRMEQDQESHLCNAGT